MAADGITAGKNHLLDDCPKQGFALAALALAGTLLVAAPVRAQQAQALAVAPADGVAGLDALSYATDNPETGIALASNEAAAGDLLDALATLERVLLNHPGNDAAQIFHASLLCRLDDFHGAELEFEKLRGRNVTATALAQARKPCLRGPNSGWGG